VIEGAVLVGDEDEVVGGGETPVIEGAMTFFLRRPLYTSASHAKRLQSNQMTPAMKRRP
jgi:hypothetical protein